MGKCYRAFVIYVYDSHVHDNRGNLPTYMVYVFAKTSRCTAIGIAYNLSNAIFAGTAPFVQSHLVLASRDLKLEIFPGLYISVIALISLSGLFVIENLRKKKEIQGTDDEHPMNFSPQEETMHE